MGVRLFRSGSNFVRPCTVDPENFLGVFCYLEQAPLLLLSMFRSIFQLQKVRGKVVVVGLEASGEV
jgi:hypothetical protein